MVYEMVALRRLHDHHATMTGNDRGGGSRDEGGRWNPQFEDDEFLDAVESLPVAGTQHVSDEVGCSYDLAYRRLKRLEENGRVSSEKVGGSFIWFVTDDGD